MNNIYDNGETILGNVKDVINYISFGINWNSEDEQIVKGLLNDLKELTKNTIVYVNLANGIDNYSIDFWNDENIIKGGVINANDN